MRFLHTADWQLGMRAAHLGAAGPAVRAARLRALEQLGVIAARAGAEFVVVAGDVFEDHAVDRVLVQQAADALVRFARPVYLLPGNHDPACAGAVWEHPVWRELAGRGVTVLRDAQRCAVPGGYLYPCVTRARHGASDPTLGLRRGDESDAVHVGVAHGTVAGEQLDEPDFPIARDACERAGLDYLALGHWHSTSLYADARGAVRMAYAGTHEPTRFGERDSGNALVVEVAAPGLAPQVTSVRSAVLRWHSLERSLAAAGDVARVREELERLPSPEAAVLRLRLSGALRADEQEALERLGDEARARFLYARVEVEARPAPDDDAWLEGLPPGPVRVAAERLRARAAQPGEEGERAALALLELFALAHEVEAVAAPALAAPPGEA